MNNNKQTAVEWLVEQLFADNEIFGCSKELLQQAKQREKEQIMFDYINGVIDTLKGHENVDSDKYYNEKYGKL